MLVLLSNTVSDPSHDLKFDSDSPPCPVSAVFDNNTLPARLGLRVTLIKPGDESLLWRPPLEI